MNTVQFFVSGDPKPQPRPRAFARRFGEKYQARVYNPATAEGWKNQIAEAARHFIPFKLPLFDGPVSVGIEFVFRRPKAHFRSNGMLKPGVPHWFSRKPDRDNLEKAVLDALTVLGFWGDDGQVCAGPVSKRYARLGELPGAHVTIAPIHQGAHPLNTKLRDPRP